MACKDNVLTATDIRALAWAIDNAEDWRGSMTGNPDPEPLREFDAAIAKAKAALRKVRATRRAAQSKRTAGWDDVGAWRVK